MTGLRKKRRSSKQILLRKAVKRRTSDIAVKSLTSDFPRSRTSPQAKAITVVSSINRGAPFMHHSASSWEPREHKFGESNLRSDKSIPKGNLDISLDRAPSRSSKWSKASSSGYPSSWNLEVPRCDEVDEMLADPFSLNKLLNSKPQGGRCLTRRTKKCNTGVQCRMPHRSRQKNSKTRSTISSPSVSHKWMAGRVTMPFDGAPQRVYSGETKLRSESINSLLQNNGNQKGPRAYNDGYTSSDCSCECDPSQSNRAAYQPQEIYGRIQGQSRPPPDSYRKSLDNGKERSSSRTSQQKGNDIYSDRIYQDKGKAHSQRGKEEGKRRDSSPKSQENGNRRGSYKSEEKSKRGAYTKGQANSNRIEIYNNEDDCRGIENRRNEEKGKGNSNKLDNQRSQYGCSRFLCPKAVRKSDHFCYCNAEENLDMQGHPQAEDKCCCESFDELRGKQNGSEVEIMIDERRTNTETARPQSSNPESISSSRQLINQNSESSLRERKNRIDQTTESPKARPSANQAWSGTIPSSRQSRPQTMPTESARNSIYRAARNQNIDNEVDNRQKKKVDAGRCIKVPCTSGRRKTDQKNSNDYASHYCYCDAIKNGTQQPREGCDCENSDPDEPKEPRNANVNQRMIEKEYTQSNRNGKVTSQSDNPFVSGSRQLTTQGTRKSRLADVGQKPAQSFRGDGIQGSKGTATPFSKKSSLPASTTKSAQSSPKPSKPGAPSRSKQSTGNTTPKECKPLSVKGKGLSRADSPKPETKPVAKGSAASKDKSYPQTANTSLANANATQNSDQFTSRKCEACEPSNEPCCMFGNPQWSHNCRYPCYLNRAQTWDGNTNRQNICNCYCQCCLRAINQKSAAAGFGAEAKPTPASWVEQCEEEQKLTGPLGSSPTSSSRSAANAVGSYNSSTGSKTDSKQRSLQGSGLCSDSDLETNKVTEKCSSKLTISIGSAENCHSTCPNCGININEFLRNSRSQGIEYSRIKVEEHKNVYQPPLQANPSAQFNKQQEIYESYENNDGREEIETKPPCNNATCIGECKKCNILPAEGNKGEPLVNLVVSDKCNIQQLIEILNETSAKLEAHQNLLNQSPKTGVNPDVFDFDDNKTNINSTWNDPQNMDKQYMIENRNTQPYQSQDSPNVDYNCLPSNAYPQYDPRYEAPNSGNSPNSLRILTQTEYDYPDPLNEPCQQNDMPNYSFRNECVCHPAFNHYSRRCCGSGFPNFTSDNAKTSPVGKQEVLQKNLHSKSFLDLLDLTLAIKKNREDFQKYKVLQSKHKIQLSHEKETELKVNDCTGHRNDQKLDRVYKEINPTQHPSYLEEVFNNWSMEKFEDKSEETKKNSAKFECNFYKVDARGNKSWQRKRFLEVDYSAQKNRKDNEHHPYKYKTKALPHHRSQEKILRKKLHRKPVDLEQSTSDLNSNYTPQIRKYELKERDIRERKSSGFDQMEICERLPKSYGFDTCRREFYNGQEKQSEASYFESYCRRRPPRKVDSLGTRERSSSKFQNLSKKYSKYNIPLRRRGKDKKESQSKIQAEENLRSRSSFLFRKNHKRINKVVPLENEVKESKINFTKRSKDEIKENKYFEYSELRKLESRSNLYTNKRKSESEKSDHAESKNSKSQIKIQHFPIRRTTVEKRVSEKPNYVESRSRVLPIKLVGAKGERPDIKRESERSDELVLKKMESRNGLHSIRFRKSVGEGKSEHAELKSFEEKRKIFNKQSQIKDRRDKAVTGNLVSNKSVTSLSMKQTGERKAKDESLNLKAISFKPNSNTNKIKREMSPLHQEKVFKKCIPVPPPKPVKQTSRQSVAISASNHKDHRARIYQQNQSDGDDIKVLYDSSSRFSRHSCGDGDTNTECESDTKPKTSQNNFFSMFITRDKLTVSKRYSG